jgi:hypothetical protein
MIQMLAHSEISYRHDHQIGYMHKINRQQITLALQEQHTPEIICKKITVLGKWHINSDMKGGHCSDACSLTTHDI